MLAVEGFLLSPPPPPPLLPLLPPAVNDNKRGEEGWDARAGEDVDDW